MKQDTTANIPSLKPDLKEVAQRFHAWWAGEKMDRPVLEIAVTPDQEPTLPVSHHASLRERWLDVDFQVESAVARVRSGIYLAETLPVYMPDVGPDLTSTLFGEELEFGENTSWATHRIQDVDEWENLLNIEADFENLYWKRIEEMTALALRKGGKHLLVGLPDLHGAFDTLVSLRGPEDLCLDMMEEPELVAKVAKQISSQFNIALERCWKTLKAHGQGSTSWARYYHEDLAYIPSCDFWCLISPEMAREHVIQSIALEAAPLKDSLFHLDGPDALRHLDWVLEGDLFSAVQWVFGAGQGQARDWIHIYKQILDTGKSIQVLAQSADDALEVVSKVGKRGVWVSLYEPFADQNEAEDFIRRMETV